MSPANGGSNARAGSVPICSAYAVLRGQLTALDDGPLRNIIREYAISDLGAVKLSALARDELIAMIVVAAERRVA